MLPMVEVLTPYVDVKLVPLPPTKHIFKKGWASSIVLQILFLSWAFMIWSWLPILLLLFILVVDLVLWKWWILERLLKLSCECWDWLWKLAVWYVPRLPLFSWKASCSIFWGYLTLVAWSMVGSAMSTWSEHLSLGAVSVLVWNSWGASMFTSDRPVILSEVLAIEAPDTLWMAEMPDISNSPVSLYDLILLIEANIWSRIWSLFLKFWKPPLVAKREPVGLFLSSYRPWCRSSPLSTLTASWLFPDTAEEFMDAITLAF